MIMMYLVNFGDCVILLKLLLFYSCLHCYHYFHIAFVVDTEHDDAVQDKVEYPAVLRIHVN